jgi:hypothetical protein
MLISLPAPWRYPSSFITNGTVGSTNVGTLDAAGEYTAFLFTARQAMTISHVGVYAGVSGSPTADVRIETVDMTTGVPSGTLWDTDTNIVTGTLVSGNNLVALTASATIAIGDQVAVKVAYNSGTSLNLSYSNSMVGTSSNSPYLVTYTGGAAAKQAVPSKLVMSLGSSTTAFYSVDGLIPAVPANMVWDSGDSPVTRGLRFQLPFAARVCGLALFCGNDDGAFDYALYDDAGATLETASFDPDFRIDTTSGMIECIFDAPVSLDADTWYRAAVTATTSGTDTRMYTLTLPSLNYRTAVAWGENAHYATFAGSWTDTATAVIPLVCLLIDQIDNGGGGTQAKLLTSTLHPIGQGM